MMLKKQEIPTPALVVDLEKLQYNITEMAERGKKAGMRLRPHIKTHKTPIIAHMQLKAGAIGIACAKLGEAEVMAAAGIEDIFIPYPIVGPDKVERLLNLARWTPRISTSVDTFDAMRALNQAAVARGQRIDVIVEVEAGYHRTGVYTDNRLVQFVREIVTERPGLNYKGLMYMAGGTCKSADPDEQRAGEMAGAKVATDAAALLKQHGIETEVIAGGSTPGSLYMADLAGVNEYRPGCYVFGDMKYADLGALTREQMSATILTTVVSVPWMSEPDHFVVDAGSKTVTHSDATTTPGYGVLVQYPNLSITVASEEHGAVRIPETMRNGFDMPAIGAKLDIWPNYVSDVVNMFDYMWVVQGDDVVACWDILARGKRV
jgi:D-serine deaminase-like pyridoxal phosphate-dependent protein